MMELKNDKSLYKIKYKIIKKQLPGGAGHRSRYLSHAKRALYHLSYAPTPDINNMCDRSF